MPRTIGVALEAHLDGDALTLATCVLITRLDGTKFGFTSVNQTLTISGVDYSYTDSFQPTAVKQTADSGVDNLEIVSLLSDDRITDEDLQAGRYDGAEVELFLVNWADLAMGKLVLLTATIGDITFKDGVYVAEIRSRSNQLKMQVGDVTTGLCRVKRLGDAQCKASFTTDADKPILSDLGSSGRLHLYAGSVSDQWVYGIVRGTSGENDGIEREVKSVELTAGKGILVLRQSFPFPVLVGDTFDVEQGCDRTISTCIDEFDNSINFHGEPYLPGNSRITQTGRPPS